MVISLSSRFSSVILACLRKGICQYELKALPGLTQTGSELIWQNFPQPHAKKSPSGHSTDGSVSSSQYIRTMNQRVLSSGAGVIQICVIAPGPVISASVNVDLAGTGA